MTKIGFTGSRKGMSKKQKDIFAALVEANAPFELHHGDCVGADEYAHNWYDLYSIQGKRIVVHPPIKDDLRAFCSVTEQGLYILATENGTIIDTREEKDYLDRNRDIVDETDWLMAFPNRESTRISTGGGTWYTIRYARSQGKEVLVVYANGEKQCLK